MSSTYLRLFLQLAKSVMELPANSISGLSVWGASNFPLSLLEIESLPRFLPLTGFFYAKSRSLNCHVRLAVASESLVKTPFSELGVRSNTRLRLILPVPYLRRLRVIYSR